MIEIFVSMGFLGGLYAVGAWLETINGIHDPMDRFLTPVPLSIAGMIILLERSLA